MKNRAFLGMVASLLFSLSALGSPCATGRCPDAVSEAPHPAVVRVVVENSRTRNFGTGTWVTSPGRERFVLTCAHLFESQEAPRQISVHFPNAQAFRVQLLSLDRTWDLAVLDPETPGQNVPNSALRNAWDLSPEPVTICGTYPTRGESLSFAGYGPDGRYRRVPGVLQGYCRVRDGDSAETLVVQGVARQGDSGGPILNARGELVGVLWGTDGQSVCGTYQGRILQFLESVFPVRNVPQAPVCQPPQTCPPQGCYPGQGYPACPPQASGASERDLARLIEALRDLQSPPPVRSSWLRLLSAVRDWFWPIVALLAVYVYYRRRNAPQPAATPNTGDQPQ